jgi:Cu(I)/Ag(I) efflux system protein CusF
MKNILTIAASIVLPIGLSGCDKKPESFEARTSKAAAPADAMSGMAMPAGSKMGQASGTVTAIDAAAGKITLDHGAIPAVGWPPMKMGFSAKPELLKGVVVGDKVDFNVTVTGNAGEVTAINKREG